MVKVSGFFDGNGNIQATRIEGQQPPWTPTTILEIKGLIKTINTSGIGAKSHLIYGRGLDGRYDRDAIDSADRFDRR